MGSVMYRRVTNVLEVTPDVFVHFVGKGLIVNRREFLEKDEESVQSQGIKNYWPDPEAAIKIEVDCGAGLDFGENGELDVLLGKCLKIEDDGNISVDVGMGLDIRDNKLCVQEAIPDVSKESTFDVLIDSVLSFDGQMIKLIKTYQKFTVCKNCTGRVIDIIAGDITEDVDEFMLNVCYGGYGNCGPKPCRDGTNTEPNFYQK